MYDSHTVLVVAVQRTSRTVVAVSLEAAHESDFDLQDNKSWKHMFPTSLVDMSFDVDDQIITLHDDG